MVTISAYQAGGKYHPAFSTDFALHFLSVTCPVASVRIHINKILKINSVELVGS